MFRSSTLNSIFLAAALLLSVGCTKEDSSDDSSASASSESGSFRTSCGTVYKGDLQNPIDKDDAQKGKITVAGANLLIFESSEGGSKALLKLHDLGVQYDDARAKAAQFRMKNLAAEGDVYYYQATKGCEVELDNGGKGTIGQVFSAKGTNFSEALISTGLANIETDECNGNLLTSCYTALEEEAAQTIAGELDSFLWKPISDSNGRLAIHTGPYDTTVIVLGETGTNSGPGNGYGSLARFSKPGCAYGAEVKVRVVDTSSGAAYTLNGNDTITIPNGCNRYCIKEGQIALCPKR